MPVYDVAERHRTVVRAAPEVVFAAIRSADLSGGLLTRALLVVHAVPAALVALVRSPGAALAELQGRRAERRGGLRLAGFERAGFRVVAERAPQELVIGLLGFWTPRGELRSHVSAADFAVGPPPGHALAGWSFHVAARRRNLRAAHGGARLLRAGRAGTLPCVLAPDPARERADPARDAAGDPA